MRTINATVAKYAKMATSLVWLVLAGVAMFVFVDPAFKIAVIALIPALSGVILVFGTKNATADAIDKAMMQLFNGIVGVVAFYITIPASTVTNVGILIAAFASAYTVWRVPNKTQPPGT